VSAAASARAAMPMAKISAGAVEALVNRGESINND
jgi:hypothetical protein